MIYNFAQLLKDQFPSELVYTNGRTLIVGQDSIPARNILVMETGGTEKPWNRFRNASVQILARDDDVTDARELAYDVFNFLTSRFGLLLPGVTVNGKLYPGFKTAQIAAIQLPHFIGLDTESRNVYSTNYEIIMEG